MIGRLRGELLEIDSGMVVVDAGGVGYEVMVPESVLAGMPEVGERVELFTRQVFREDGVSLYGFAEAYERKLFDKLIEVKGCGPKIGLSLLGQLGADIVTNSIVGQDAKMLAKATGVGPRLAERIILELKDKLQADALIRKVSATGKMATPPPPITNDLIEVLLALGYRRQEAEAAADEAMKTEGTVEEQLKIALRSLAR